MVASDGVTEDGKIGLRLFGSAELRTKGSLTATDEFVGRSKQLAFLTYLELARHGDFYRRDSLVVLFWPELDTDHARSSLRNTLSRIRSGLGPDVIETRGAEELRTRPGIIDCDVTEFRSAIATGDYQKAMDLYKGDLLEGFHTNAAAQFEAWLEQTRHSLRDSAASAAKELCSLAAARGDDAGALSWMRRRLEILPDDEDGLRDFMQFSARIGDRSAALRMYSIAGRRMTEAYGLPLSAATTNLAAEIRAAADGPGVASPGLAQRESSSTGAHELVPASVRGTDVSTVPGFRPWLRWRLLLLVVPAVAAVAIAAIRRIPGKSAIPVEKFVRWISLQTVSGPVPRAFPSMIYEPRLNEAVVFGGRSFETVVGDVWRLYDANGVGKPRWERVPTSNPGPGRRWLHEAAYDARSDRMIVFGGSTGYTTPCKNDVWILPGAMRGMPPLTWFKLDVAEGPAPRAEMAVAYDAPHRRLIVSGGHDCIAPIHNDLWILANANGIGRPEWLRQSPAVPQGSPGPRRNHSLLYDPLTNRAILFGGRAGYGGRAAGFTNDLWILLNANGVGRTPEWRKFEYRGDSPPPLGFHRALYDGETNRALVIGGMPPATGIESPITNQAWELIGATGGPGGQVWHKLRATSPPGITSFAVAYDPVSNRAIVFGGSTYRRATSGLFLLDHAVEH